MSYVTKAQRRDMANVTWAPDSCAEIACAHCGRIFRTRYGKGSRLTKPQAATRVLDQVARHLHSKH